MKKLYILSALFTFSAVVQAQTITRGNLPMVNDSVAGVYVTNQAVWDAGTSGVGQTWDFSGWAGDIAAFQYGPVASNSPFAPSEMELGLAGVGKLYFNTSSTEMHLSGTYSEVGGENLAIPYTDPQKIFAFPFAYGDEVIDTARGTFSTTVNVPYLGNVPATNDRIVYSRTEADGQGTLILPNRSYSNVIRAKITSVIKDSIYSTNPLAQGIYQIINSSTEEYFFLSPDFNHQLIYMMRVESEAQPNPIDIRFYFPGAIPLSASSAYSKGALNIFPNPVESILNIEGVEAGNMIRVVDQMGVEVLRSAAASSRIDVSTLSPGIYHLDVKSEGDVIFNGKFVKK